MTQDLEKAVKAEQAASLLVSDLRDLARADDALLSILAIDLITQAAALQNRLILITESVQTNGGKKA